MGRCAIARCSTARAGSLLRDGTPPGRLLASGHPGRLLASGPAGRLLASGPAGRLLASGPAGRLLASGPWARGGLTLASQGGPPAGLDRPPSGDDGRWDIAGIGVSSANAAARTHYVQVDHC